MLSPALTQGYSRGGGGGAGGGGLVAELYPTLATPWIVACHGRCFANGGSFILFIFDCAVRVQGLSSLIEPGPLAQNANPQATRELPGFSLL